MSPLSRAAAWGKTFFSSHHDTSQGLGVRSCVEAMLHHPCHCQRAPDHALCTAAHWTPEPATPGNAEMRLGITRLGSFQPHCRVPAGVLTLGLFVFLLAWLTFVLESHHCTASGTDGAVLELLLCFSASIAPAAKRESQ